MLGRLYRWLPWPAGSPAPPTAFPANDNRPGPGRAAGTVPSRASVPSLATATRDYDRALANGTFETLRERDLAMLFLAMGPELWAWQYARRLTGQPPWRAGPNADERFERARLLQEMTMDIVTWERAIAAIQAETDRARLGGKPPRGPLVIPVAVQGIIEARRKAAIERATRRRDRGGESGSGPTPVPSEAVAHPPFPGKTA